MSDDIKLDVEPGELSALGIEIGRGGVQILHAIVKRNVLAERERCAKIAEDIFEIADKREGMFYSTDEIAAAIRRGTP